MNRPDSDMSFISRSCPPDFSFSKVSSSSSSPLRDHPDTITAHLRAFFDQCGFNNVRLHDARHTFSTILQEPGASKEDTRDRLGHADLEMTEHYTHPEEQGGEFEILEDRLPFMLPEDTEKPH